MTLWLTTLAMIAFAGNSLLARLGMASGTADPLGFTGLRLSIGAAVLALILQLSHARKPSEARRFAGSWASAAALFVYALAFSLAYGRVGAAVGALVLFAAVQATMIAWGLFKGERPSLREALGLAAAFAAFVWWLTPGLTRPDPLGTGLMVLSGAAWGVYSLRGRGAGDPMRATAGNFIRTLPLALPLIAVSAIKGGMTGEGILIAAASGGITSALGYILWYRALGGLTALSAAIVQLCVPVIAALGAVLFLSETLGPRFVLAGLIVIGGIAFALLSKRRAI
ncbi:DMT family transporter [Aurantimonas sp. VKM B-3413]|uniref:DMT family transporter n=1 Tax=Aurantimonas sp. VKM B-3413 TaxID=2779401 RepID=UPI001E5FE692|nr:DMT family transporter [Aurantimonas sp. VKM B-3413]MCB8838174.1 DMT family transporter [Aurantimonas sp. VKM B-3413]